MRQSEPPVFQQHTAGHISLNKSRVIQCLLGSVILYGGHREERLATQSYLISLQVTRDSSSWKQEEEGLKRSWEEGTERRGEVGVERRKEKEGTKTPWICEFTPDQNSGLLHFRSLSSGLKHPETSLTLNETQCDPENLLSLLAQSLRMLQEISRHTHRIDVRNRNKGCLLVYMHVLRARESPFLRAKLLELGRRFRV